MDLLIVVQNNMRKYGNEMVYNKIKYKGNEDEIWGQNLKRY